MKKFFFSVAALAAAISFTACSSEDVVVNGGAGVEPGSTGYLAFNISMPKDNGTRANDNFAEGDVKEYTVKNAILLLFDGADDATAKFHSAYDLGVGPNGGVWADDDHAANVPGTGSVENGNITVDNKYIAKVDASPANPKLFVVLNNNGVFSVDANVHTLSVNGANFPVGRTFKDLQDMTRTDLNLNADKFTENGILMMNAHLWSIKGEGQNPSSGVGHILSDAAGKIYESKAAAEAVGAESADVFVERAVAKVTVKSSATDLTEDALPFDASIEGWVLDNTNKSSYLVRTIEGFDGWKAYHTAGKYRMVGNTTVGHTAGITFGDNAGDFYRTYFAKDTNYGTDVEYGTDTNKAYDKATDSYPLVNLATSAYCAENTFDVDRMKYGNTTRVIFKAKITPSAGQATYGDGFYSQPGQTVFYTEDNMKDLIHNHVSAYLSELKDANMITGTGTPTYEITGVMKDGVRDYTQFNVKVSGISAAADLQTTDADTYAVIEALTGAGKAYSVHSVGYDYYEDGVCYYDARIQHFGNFHTPWDAHNSQDVDEAYHEEANGSVIANVEERFLGRWGVLRNNWYELDVTKIGKIGYAHPWNLSFDKEDNPEDPNEPPYDPETPDDNQKSELWISVDVNILSWAKRPQNVEL